MKNGINAAILSAAIFSSNLHADHALAEQIRQARQLILDKYSPTLSGGLGYSDYRFNSNTSGGQYNRYDGTNKSVSLGEFNYIIGSGVSIGGAVFAANAESSGRSLITGGVPTGFSQSTNTLGINASLSYQLKTTQPVNLNLFVGYAQNQTQTTSILNAGLPTEVSGRANYGGNNGNIGFSVKTSWVKAKWLLTGFATYAYAVSYQDSYSMNIAGTNTNNQSLTMSQHNFSETLQLQYQLKNNVSPFAVLTLIQGLDRRYSRNITSSVLASSVNAPKFQTALNGVQIGTGIAIQYKQLSMSPVYRYQRQGSEFSSHNVAMQLGLKLY